MEALIIGGYGYVGSRLTEKMVKEGIPVSILDHREEDSYYKIPRVKHNYFEIDYFDMQSEQYVSNKQFDIAAVILEEYRLVSLSNRELMLLFSNIGNILHTLGKKKVKKVVFLSSLHLYDMSGCGVSEDTPTAVKTSVDHFYFMCEQLCESLSELYHFGVASLRAAEVYGEGQNIETGLLPSLLLHSGQTVKIHLEQKIPCVYIGDLVEALYKAVLYSRPPLLNIVADEYWSFEQISGRLGFSEIQEKELQPYPPADNSLAKKSLDWTPLYGFENGFERLYQWYQEDVDIGVKQRARHKSWRQRLSMAKPVIHTLENLLLFSVCVALTFFPSPLISSISVDFNLLYIIIIGSFFGIRQSMCASVFASILLFVQQIVSGVPIPMLLVDFNTLILVMTYLSVAIGLGYVIESSREKAARLKMELQSREDDYQTLNALYRENLDTLNSLEEKIYLFDSSSNYLADAFLSLDSLEPQELAFHVVKAVKKVLDARCVSLYLITKNRQFLRIDVTSDEDKRCYRNSVAVADHPELERLLTRKQIFINTRMQSNVPSMMGPLVVNGECVAVLMANFNRFTDHSQYRINLFKLLTKIVNSSFSKAYAYEEKLHQEKYFSDTGIMTEGYFGQKLCVLLQAEKKNLIHFTLLEICGEQGDYQMLSEKVEYLIRDEDVMGLYQGRLCVLLNHTGIDFAKLVTERLQNAGISSRVWEEELHMAEIQKLGDVI